MSKEIARNERFGLILWEKQARVGIRYIVTTLRGAEVNHFKNKSRAIAWINNECYA